MKNDKIMNIERKQLIELVDYFKKNSIPEFEKISKFQIDSSRLTLTIENKKSIN
ncbi:hypothetical protein [Flavobacterium yafengii]|uniref:hypothetical protein n=1 Tax=Flavobacterium yafengii TaxID=3041253 RepID=UPI0024A8E0B6|nr:hypothetical protein [Flavobacterium yafengii]MDI5888592.1 hypothetical protein [Flavobacterium yafengii]